MCSSDFRNLKGWYYLVLVNISVNHMLLRVSISKIFLKVSLVSSKLYTHTRWGKNRFTVVCMEINPIINIGINSISPAHNYKPTFVPVFLDPLYPLPEIQPRKTLGPACTCTHIKMSTHVVQSSGNLEAT